MWHIVGTQYVVGRQTLTARVRMVMMMGQVQKIRAGNPRCLATGICKVGPAPRVTFLPWLISGPVFGPGPLALHLSSPEITSGPQLVFQLQADKQQNQPQDQLH